MEPRSHTRLGVPRDLVEPGMTAEKLLMKYARMSEQNGQRFFTPR